MPPIADLFWQHIQSSVQLADFRRFLALFPDTTHSAEARVMLLDTPMRDDETEEETLGQFMLAILEVDKSAKAGDAEAAFILGRVAAEGVSGFPRDASSAARWWQQACGLGHARACAAYARAQLFGQGVERNLEEGLALLQAQADAGDGEAACSLGDFHLRLPPQRRDLDAGRDWLERAVALGDASAVVKLAASYLSNEAPNRDVGKAVAWLSKAAEAGNAEAAYLLGHLLLKGQDDVPRDVKTAIHWLERAYADTGNSRLRALAAFALGRHTILDEVAPHDAAGALRWLHLSAREGHEEACHLLAALFARGHAGIIANQKESFLWLLRAARLGSLDGCHQVGEACLLGRGTEQDAARAVRWMRHAARRGHAFAQGHLAYLHWTQEGGLTRDEAEIYKWSRLAALQKEPGGMWLLGECLMRGVGTAVDESGAVEWFRKAAEAGHTAAQSRLAQMYYFGIVVAEDNAEAGKWASIAAENDNAEAQCLLGEMFVFGHGVELDYEAGAQWLRAAADQGETRASGLYGVLCALGAGVPRNWMEALRWLKPAARAGDERAQAFLKDHDMVWAEPVLHETESGSTARSNVTQLHPPKFPLDRFIGTWQFEGMTLHLKPGGEWQSHYEVAGMTAHLSGTWSVWGDRFSTQLDACDIALSEAEIREINKPNTVLHIDATALLLEDPDDLSTTRYDRVAEADPPRARPPCCPSIDIAASSARRLET
jgi:hypothetical protein